MEYAFFASSVATLEGGSGWEMDEPRMIVRLASSYIRCFGAFVAALFLSAVSVHIAVLAGICQPYYRLGIPLFRTGVGAGMLLIPFIKDRLFWFDQVKHSPQWMWKGAVALAFYAIVISISDVLMHPRDSFAGWAVAISAFPLAFQGFYLCILFSVIRSSYLGASEIVKSTRDSMILAVIGILFLVANHFGFLPHHR